MCFHCLLSKPISDVEKHFNAVVSDPSMFRQSEHFNGFAHPDMSVIANDQPNVIQQYQWGLVPHWARDDSIKKSTLNARIETLQQKPSFRQSVKKRCLVIANGFYEWQDIGAPKKQKYRIELPNQELFAFGGIWAEWVNKATGEVIKSFSIITAPAVGIMAEIHNTKQRMPIVLSNAQYSDWLNADSDYRLLADYRQTDFRACRV